MIFEEKQKNAFSAISLSRASTTRKTDQLSQDIQNQLDSRVRDFIAFSITLEEFTDLIDTAQLAIFVQGVDSSLQVAEDLLDMCSIKGITTGQDILDAVVNAMEKRQLSLEKLGAITTDGAAAMIGHRNGFVSLDKQKLQNEGIMPLLLQFHCIIHQEHLCAKTRKMRNVLKVVKETVNYIRSRPLKHQQFQTFLDKINSVYKDAPYYAEVRWLSRGKMVNRSYQLQDEISEFCHSHGRDVPEFSDSDFVDDFAFLVDMFNQLNELNTKLQGDKQLIFDLYRHVVGGFHGKLKVWEDLFEEAFVDEDYFPTLSKRPNIKERCKRYMEKLSALREEFERRCADFKSVKDELCAFSAPLLTEVAIRLRVDVADLHTDLVYSLLFAPHFFRYISLCLQLDIPGSEPSPFDISACLGQHTGANKCSQGWAM